MSRKFGMLQASCDDFESPLIISRQFKRIGGFYLKWTLVTTSTSTATQEKRFCVHVHVLEFYYLKISINLITMSNDICFFYPSELLRHDRQGRLRNKFFYKKWKFRIMPKVMNIWNVEQSTMLLMQSFYIPVSPYESPRKDTIARWVKNTLTEPGVNTKVFSSQSCTSSASSNAENMGVDLDNILKLSCRRQKSTFRRFYSKNLE